MNAVLWAVSTLPHRTCEQSLEPRGSQKAPGLQLLDLREEGIFFLPVPSPVEGGCVAGHCQDWTPAALPSVTCTLRY